MDKILLEIFQRCDDLQKFGVESVFVAIKPVVITGIGRSSFSSGSDLGQGFSEFLNLVELFQKYQMMLNSLKTASENSNEGFKPEAGIISMRAGIRREEIRRNDVESLYMESNADENIENSNDLEDCNDSDVTISEHDDVISSEAVQEALDNLRKIEKEKTMNSSENSATAPSRNQYSTRNYTKRVGMQSFCFYCLEEVTGSIESHLFVQHRDEFRVRKISALSKRSIERMVELEILINEGNFQHNVNVMNEGNGQLVLSKQVSSGFVNLREPSDYRACDDCKKMVLKESLRRHLQFTCLVRRYKNIIKKQDVEEMKNKVSRSMGQNRVDTRKRKGDDRAVESIQHNEIFDLLLDQMIPGATKDVFLADELIRQYTIWCLNLRVGDSDEIKKLPEKTFIYRIRRLANIVVKAGETLPGVDLSTLLSPEHFEIVVEISAGMCRSGGACNSANRICCLLSQALKIKSQIARERSDASKIGESDDFKKLLECKFMRRVCEIVKERRSFGDGSIPSRNRSDSDAEDMNYSQELDSKCYSTTSEVIENFDAGEVDLQELDEEKDADIVSCRNIVSDDEITDIELDPTYSPDQFERNNSKTRRTSEQKLTRIRRSTLKRRWDTEEDEAFVQIFRRNLKEKQMPKSSEITFAQKNFLKDRTVKQIGARLHNIITNKQKVNFTI